MSASADIGTGSTLGDFDLEQLRIFRSLAERHVRKALDKALTAAADPSDYIDESYLEEFIDQASVAWVEGRNLIQSTIGELPAPLFNSTINASIKSAADNYMDILRAVIAKKLWTDRTPIFGEFMKGQLVQYGDVRPMLVRLGGGTTDSTVPLMGGVATGNTMKQWLSNNGIETNKKIWLYGYEDEPRRTFNGHLQMDGLVFERWDEEGLEIAPQDAWLRRTHYQPGDHWGCACVVAPYIPNFDDPYELELPSV